MDEAELTLLCAVSGGQEDRLDDVFGHKGAVHLRMRAFSDIKEQERTRLS